MDDVQNQKDIRGIKIQQTGVNNVCLPLLILGQQVQAIIRFTVSLQDDLRGTHMSRLMEILTEWTTKSITFNDMENILNDALDKLNTDFSSINIKFKYFVERKAPVSEKASLLGIDCSINAELRRGEQVDFIMGIAVPITTLCPCSKEISNFGAHNQRSICRIKIKLNKDNYIDIDELAKLVEQQASSPVFPLLKREDEKFVTESAYNNPKFVEDILRDVVLAIRKINGVKWFSVECENFESIHGHNAFALHEETLQAHHLESHS